MTMELSSIRVVRKPWGKLDLRPWSELGHDGSAVGELWFQRTEQRLPEPALLLKLLFVDETLSIQVHPDDTFAHAMGLPHGKTEAWYVVSADPGARVALGLKRTLTPPQLRSAIEDGSIAELVHWHDVVAGETILVPAGTIHAIGAGLVVAEIQQRGDTTFRLFDYGRQRETHLDSAVGAATAAPATPQAPPTRLSEARNVVAQSPYFILEEIDLAPNSHWGIDASVETWLLLLEGDAALDLTPLNVGEAMFLQAHRASMRVGDNGAKGLLAYAADAPIFGIMASRNGIPLAVIAERFPELGLGHRGNIDLPKLPWGVRS
jgi:mannose-6-phosphate isomerase